MQHYEILVIDGDGIGPEIMQATIRTLQTVAELHGGFDLTFEHHQAGAQAYLTSGHSISDETVNRAFQVNAILKAPTGLPDVRRPDGTEAGMLGGAIRPVLDLFANVRPLRLYPGVTAAVRHVDDLKLDCTIVRENTEGLYVSRGKGIVTSDVAIDSLVITRAGTERVARFAFELARSQPSRRTSARKVTCVDKGNVLRSYQFFRDVFDSVATDYPDISTEHRHTDACAHDLVMFPDQFDILVMENFVGDLLSDLGGGLVGGMGMCPSANIGHEHAMFEPAHGTAPSLSGKNLANPLSAILSGKMMLEWLGEREAASALDQAVESTLASGQLQIMPNGTPNGGTSHVTEVLADALRKNEHGKHFR